MLKSVVYCISLSSTKKRRFLGVKSRVLSAVRWKVEIYLLWVFVKCPQETCMREKSEQGKTYRKRKNVGEGFYGIVEIFKFNDFTMMCTIVTIITIMIIIIVTVSVILVMTFFPSLSPTLCCVCRWKRVKLLHVQVNDNRERKVSEKIKHDTIRCQVNCLLLKLRWYLSCRMFSMYRSIECARSIEVLWKASLQANSLYPSSISDHP